MQGYKAFNKNMECRGFQFKEGEPYSLAGEVKLGTFLQKYFGLSKILPSQI